jgi:hypothetical protein
MHIGMQLSEIANANPAVAIASYPVFDPQHGPNTNVVLRARDAKKLALAKRAVEDMLERVRRAQSNSARALPGEPAKTTALCQVDLSDLVRWSLTSV